MLQECLCNTNNLRIFLVSLAVKMQHDIHFPNGFLTKVLKIAISLHGLFYSSSLLQIQIVLIILLQRKIPNFDALLATLYVTPKAIMYKFNLKSFPKTFLKIGSTFLIQILVLLL